MSQDNSTALVYEHVSLVRQIVRRYMHRLPATSDVADLYGEGLLGLTRAHSHFDPSRGVPFGAFARIHVQGAMLSFIKKEWRAESFKWRLDISNHSLVLQPERQAAVREELNNVLENLSKLDERAQLLVAGVVQEKSLASMAKEFGFSESYAARLRRKALQSLRVLR